MTADADALMSLVPPPPPDGDRDELIVWLGRYERAAIELGTRVRAVIPVGSVVRVRLADGSEAEGTFTGTYHWDPTSGSVCVPDPQTRQDRKLAVTVRLRELLALNPAPGTPPAEAP